jgi:hypothetical protein
MIMRSFAYIFATILVHVPLSAYPDLADAEDCKSIEDETQRLACYDDYFQQARPNQARHDDSSPVNPEQSDESTGQRAESEAMAEIGADQISPPAIDYVESWLVGDFNGWSGKTIFTLENGQVWRQTNNYIRDYRPHSPIPQPKVRISKGMFGSYDLRVEGVKRIVQVRRVR